MIDRRLSIAPMMDHTDKHFRYLMRLLTKHSILYTEMITTAALIFGNRKKFLDYNSNEHPIAIQLGGSNPKEFLECSCMAENEGYNEVNLNIGCPSDRVQNGKFGACLMTEKELVAECVNNISSNIKIPVTIKTRIGIDNHDSYDFLRDFIDTVSIAGCETFIIHARKAILKGLSPKENRKIPPLDYQRVYKIKKEFPDLNIIINGGFTELDQIKSQLKYVDGVMIGRAAYQNPFLLSKIDSLIFNEPETFVTRQNILEKYKIYTDKQVRKGVNIKNLTRHIIGLYQGQPGARKYRQILSGVIPKNHSRFFEEIIKTVT
tara:strand:- start:2182 stop:3138 length:957 start_codon:yes stop_codon:yes gene_type:complete